MAQLCRHYKCSVGMRGTGYTQLDEHWGLFIVPIVRGHIAVDHCRGPILRRYVHGWLLTVNVPRSCDTRVQGCEAVRAVTFLSGTGVDVVLRRRCRSKQRRSSALADIDV